jgi:hypothetical protein
MIAPMCVAHCAHLASGHLPTRLSASTASDPDWSDDSPMRMSTRLSAQRESLLQQNQAIRELISDLDSSMVDGTA